MLKLTAQELVAELKKYIAGDEELILYAEVDFANLEELVNEFVPAVKHEVTSECLEHPKKIIGRLLNIFIWECDNTIAENHVWDALIGFCYLIRSHIGFAENEKTTSKG